VKALPRSRRTESPLALVKRLGVSLESGKGPVPSFAALIARETIRGNWWGHPKSHQIFAATRAIRDSRDVLVCRLIDGKVTFVHRRLWPALVRLAPRLNPAGLAWIREEHTDSGAHKTTSTPYPKWVPQNVSKQAAKLTTEQAIHQLGAWVTDCLRPR
jgi:hypothetical protein